MTSVIYVDLSSDSEEESSPEVKRPRRDHAKPATPQVSNGLRTEVTPVATGIKSAADMRTALGSCTPMHIPSGITVTKHSNINGNMITASSKPSLENLNNNNNNSSSLKNNNHYHQLKITTAPTTPSITSISNLIPAKVASITKVMTKSTGQAQLKSVQQQQQQQLLKKPARAATQSKPIMPSVQKTLSLTPQKSTLQKATNPANLQMSQLQKVPLPQLQQEQHLQQRLPTPQLQPQQQKLQLSSPKAITLQQLKTALPQKTQYPQMTSMEQQQPKQQNTHASAAQLPMPNTLPPKEKQQITQKPSSQQKPVQVYVAPPKQPPPAHAVPASSLVVKPKKDLKVLTPPPAHALPSQQILPSSPLRTKTVVQNILTQLGSSATHSTARTTPYKTKLSTPVESPTSTSKSSLPIIANVRSVQQIPVVVPSGSQMQSVATAGAKPPLRLLATPPLHCSSALNEPLLLNLPSTTSITPQLTPTTTPPPCTAVTTTATTARATYSGASISPINKSVLKRIQPITVLKKSDEEWRKHVTDQQKQQKQQQQQKPKDHITPTSNIVLVESPPTTPPTDDSAPSNTINSVATTIVTTSAPKRTPLVAEYASLLELCRNTDKSKDMERLIDVKLIKYYHSVHENFVRSRGFRKQLEQAMDRIRSEPDMIYVHIKCVVDELKVRRKARLVQLPPEDVCEQSSNTVSPVTPSETAKPAIEYVPPVAPQSTGNKRTDERIRKLNRTLYTITKRIAALEEADVDWNDDDDSSYLQVERFKKRACQIYEKICDLTGESKNAHRQMKQPILFNDSPYPHFNRTLSAFVNRMHEFPDYHDVLQLLEHCNKDMNLSLATFELKRIAHDAFVKVGRLLQARRKTDLYETVTHFTANAKDPAASDAVLLAKLTENNKKKTKISDVLDRFAREQDLTAEEHREARLKEKMSLATSNHENDEKPCTSAQASHPIRATKTQRIGVTNGLDRVGESGNENDNVTDDDEDDDDESDEDVDTFVDNFKTNDDLSDAESETETDHNPVPKNGADAVVDTDAHVIVNNIKRVKTCAPKDDNVIKDDDNVTTQTQPNGKLTKDSSGNMIKIMSVSSLNARVSPNNNNNNNNNNTIIAISQDQKKMQKKQGKILIDTEIIISDEDS